MPEINPEIRNAIDPKQHKIMIGIRQAAHLLHQHQNEAPLTRSIDRCIAYQETVAQTMQELGFHAHVEVDPDADVNFNKITPQNPVATLSDLSPIPQAALLSPMTPALTKHGSAKETNWSESMAAISLQKRSRQKKLPPSYATILVATGIRLIFFSASKLINAKHPII